MMLRLADLLARAEDGELDDAEDTELRILLSQDTERAAVIEQRRIALLMAACWEERSSTMIGELARSASGPQRPSRIHLRIHARSARRRWFGIEWSTGRAVVAAALLVVMILGGGAWWMPRRDLPVIAQGSFTIYGGKQFRAGDTVPLDTLVQNDDRAELALVWSDGTRIELSGPGQMQVADAKQLRLVCGAITCQVAPQPVSRPLRIHTLQAELRVVGTAFTVATDDHLTRLMVSAGTVEFTDRALNESARVGVGGSAVAGRPPLPAALARGINVLLTDINAGVWQPDARNLRRLDAIAAAGFSFVRVVIPGQRPISATGLGSSTMATLDTLLDAIAARGLAVVVSPYPLEDADLATASRDQQVLWPALATHLAARPAERVFFELCNDPRQSDGAWNAQVALLATAIRRQAPANALVVDAHMGLDGSVAALDALTPLSATGIIYAVRFFDPLLFTHQGADWLGEPYGQVAAVPYPSSPVAVDSAISRTPTARKKLTQYGLDRWDAARIDALMASAADWSRHHHLPVLVVNFGAIESAAPAARSAWMADVRSACEQHDLGWSLWQDSGAFALWTGRDQDAFDPTTLQALGLPPVRR